MKKILTLLIALGAFGAIHAQSSKEKARDIVLGGGNKSGGSTRSDSGRDIILGDGNGTDRSGRSYPSSYPSQKNRRVNKDCDHDRKDKKHKVHKSNNGKHKGWTKGKGNKHGYRD